MVDDLDGVVALGRAGVGGPARPHGIEHLLGFVPEGADAAVRLARAERAWREPAARPFPVAHDAAPGIDVLRLDTAGGETVWGLLVLVRADDPELLPHEAVVSDPADDRRRLRARLRLDVAPITLLRRTPSPGGRRPSQLAQGPPRQEAVAHDGVRHRLWRVEDETIVGAVVDGLADVEVLVADGHHRLAAARAHALDAGDASARWLLAYVTEPDAGPRLRPSGRVTDLEAVWRTARSGGVLPPKSTRFEPKPRAGLVLRELDATTGP